MWLALSVVTIAQLGVVSLDGRTSPAATAGLASSAILLALIKVRVIVREFMEVRHAPVLLRRLTDLWVVSTGAILVGGYFLGAICARG